MMASGKKDGGKNRKFGRHARNPSSINQPKRTERNKAKRAQKIVHTPPPHRVVLVSKDGRHLAGYVFDRFGRKTLVACN